MSCCLKCPLAVCRILGKFGKYRFPVKNDDALIKLAAIVQRMMKDNNTGDGNYMLSDEEKRQLMDAIDEVEKDLPKEDTGDE